MWIPRPLLRLLPTAAAVERRRGKESAEDNEESLIGQEERETVADSHPGRIRSDDFGWADRMPTPLWRHCLDVIAGDFARYRPPDRLMDAITVANAAYLAETLDTGLPVTWVVQVPWDEYWRRRYADRPPDQPSSLDGFRPDDLQPPPSGSVKSDVGTETSGHDSAAESSDVGDDTPSHDAPSALRSSYLSRLVGTAVGNVEPSSDEDYGPALAALLDACAPHVDVLACETLRSRSPDTVGAEPAHADLGPALRRLRNVRDVRLAYGRRLGARHADALGRALAAAADRLTAVAVTGSRGVDARTIDALSPHLARCAALARVDLSGCRLRSAGAASVACYASTAAALRRLDLGDNDVGPDGARALAAAALRRRRHGHPAFELNLNMNRINDIGANYLASSLASGLQPFTKLQIRFCNISKIGGMDIVQSLSYDRGLRSLEIDNNKLSLEVAIALHEIMKTNTNITYLSTLNCGFHENITNFLRNVAFHNRHNKRSQMTYTDFDYLCNELDVEKISLEVPEEEDLND